VLTHAQELMESEQIEEPVLTAYYLYLTTLVNQDREAKMRATMQIEELYRQNRTSWKLAWLLLQLSAEYQRDNTARYHFLARQFTYGCVSPIWYLESLITLSNNPTLLRKLEDYEIQVLYFGAQNGLLGTELTEQMVYLAAEMLHDLPPLTVYEADYVEPQPTVEPGDHAITMRREGAVWYVEADWLYNLVGSVNFEDRESLRYFDRVLRTSGVFQKMREGGVRDGDSVNIYDFEFDFVE